MRRLLRVAAALVAVFAVGCDWRQVVLESELAPGVRDELVRACCECLAERAAVVDPDVCGVDEPPAEAPGGAVESPCLCGRMESRACAETLGSGGVVELVGACTATDGPCEDACAGVLAYPP